MRWIAPILERIRGLVSRGEMDEELDEEFRFHLEQETGKKIRHGMSPVDARREALIAFGGVERFREQTREERGVRPLENLFQDVGYALRTFRKNPGFALVAILTLGLGIGATALVFSVFNTVVLRPLPFDDPEGLVRIREVTPQAQLMSVSDPNFLDFRERCEAFEEMAAVYTRPLILSSNGEPMRISSMAVTPGFFHMLRLSPVLGRGFEPEEHRRGGEPDVALLGNGFWQSQFAGDPSVVGRDVVLDGVSRTVIGVLPPELGPPFVFDVWLPFAADAGFPRADHRREVFARLAPGVTLQAAREELSRVQATLGGTYPESNEGWGVSVVTLREWVVGPQATRVAQVLLGAVGLLLLLACASVSNLLVARGTARRRELSLRAALGAGRGRILSQLLVEGLTLAVLGAGMGLLLAYWTIPLVRSLPSNPLPRLNQVRMDGTVVLVAVAVSALSALVFGSAPAWRGARLRLMDALRVAGPQIERGGRRMRNGLVVGQLALATVLLVGAGLLTASFLRMTSVDPGFDPTGVLMVEISAPADRYPEMAPETRTLYQELVEAVERTPGVVAAGATMASPLSDYRPSNFVAPSERSGEADDFLQIAWRGVTPGLFRALGVPLLAGSVFTETEVSGVVQSLMSGGNPPLPVVISRSLAERLWPEEDPVGKGLVWNQPGGTAMTVEGVVGDIRDLTFPFDAQPTVFLPHGVVAWPTMTLILRAEGDPAEIAGVTREAIWEVDRSLPVPGMQLMEQALGASLARPRLNLILLGIFSGSALLLAAIGLYGITAFAVGRRTREIGVRLALGAPRRGILGLVLSSGVKLAVLGTGLGLLGALALTRFMQSLLFGVQALDPETYMAVALLLGAVTLIAALIPARRALRVNPASSLQAD